MGNSAEGAYGSTDLGMQGVQAFFETHTCTALCGILGLKDRAPKECMVCHDAPRSVRFDCGHAVCCQACATKLEQAAERRALTGNGGYCPLCRSQFQLGRISKGRKGRHVAMEPTF